MQPPPLVVWYAPDGEGSITERVDTKTSPDATDTVSHTNNALPLLHVTGTKVTNN